MCRLLARIPWGACISGGLSPPSLSAREVLAVIALFAKPASRSPVPGQLYPGLCMEILFKKHFVSGPSNFSDKHMAVVKTQLWFTFSRWRENTETVESAGRELLLCQSARAAIQQTSDPHRLHSVGFCNSTPLSTSGQQRVTQPDSEWKRWR